MPFAAFAAAVSGTVTSVSPSHTHSSFSSNENFAFFGAGYFGAPAVTPCAPARATFVGML